MSGLSPAPPQTPVSPPVSNNCYAGASCQQGQICTAPPAKTGLSAGDIAAIILGILLLLAIIAIILLFFRHPKCTV